MDDLISRQALMKEFADFVRASNNSDFAKTPTWNDAVSLVGSMPSAQDEKKGEAMSEIVREMTREELVAFNNELRAENEKLKAELQEARLAVEHNRHVAEENQLKYELRYRDGIIYGLKYAIKCNGVSGGEVDRRYE